MSGATADLLKRETTMMNWKPYANFDTAWSEIRPTVEKVLKCDKSLTDTELERAFRAIRLHLQSIRGNMFYLHSETRKLLQTHVQDLYSSIPSTRSDKVLEEYVEHWRMYKSASPQFMRIYNAFDNHAMRTGEEVMLTVWKQKMIDPLKQQLMLSFINELRKVRERGDVDSSVIWNVIKSFRSVDAGLFQVDLLDEFKNKDIMSVQELKDKAHLPEDEFNKILDDLENANILSIDRSVGEHLVSKIKNALYSHNYKEIFEFAYLHEIEHYYKKEIAECIDEDKVHFEDFAEFAKKGITWLDQKNKTLKFLHEYSYSKAIKICKSEMPFQPICHLSLHLFSTKCLTYVRPMYMLLKSLQDLQVFVEVNDKFVDEFEEYVKEVTIDTVEQVKANEFVESMLSLYREYTAFVHGVFDGEPKYVAAFDRAFAAVINSRQDISGPICKLPELLARSCDFALRNISDIFDQSKQLDQVMILFKYIEDKDVFQWYYYQLLYRQLSHGLTSSNNLWRVIGNEEYMITKLRHATGPDYTRKFQELISSFENVDKSNPNKKVQSLMQITMQQGQTYLHTAIDRDRKSNVKAVILRVLKTLKRLKYHQLMIEVRSQIQYFSPTDKMLGLCIESLISEGKIW